MDPQEKKISDMINILTKIAIADNKITQKEADLLENVRINVLLYDQALENALEDGIIDDAEKSVLTTLKMRILDEAADIVTVSENVSERELKILDVILKELK